MIFKKRETKDLLFAWLGIGLCFTIILGNYSLIGGNLIKIFSGNINFNISEFIILFIISLIVTGSSFIFHELAHKYTAIYFGAKAEFVMWWKYVIGAVVLALSLGFVFIAPGAVYIFGNNITIRENGIISLAGPLTNMVMALLFFIASLLGLPSLISFLGIQINLWIAFFNLLPIGPLDGRKIIEWNPIVWISCVIPLIYFIF